MTKDDILMPKGYPSSDNKTKLELYFAVIIKVNGKSFVLPDSDLFNGFDKAKDAISKSLNVTIVGYTLSKRSQIGKNRSDKNGDGSNSRGLAAGLVVLALVLTFIIIVAVYTLRKRR